MWFSHFLNFGVRKIDFFLEFRVFRIYHQECLRTHRIPKVGSLNGKKLNNLFENLNWVRSFEKYVFSFQYLTLKLEIFGDFYYSKFWAIFPKFWVNLPDFGRWKNVSTFRISKFRKILLQIFKLEELRSNLLEFLAQALKFGKSWCKFESWKSVSRFFFIAFGKVLFEFSELSELNSSNNRVSLILSLKF